MLFPVFDVCRTAWLRCAGVSSAADAARDQMQHFVAVGMAVLRIAEAGFQNTAADGHALGIFEFA